LQSRARLSSANSLQLVRVFPLMNTAGQYLRKCRSLVQAYSNGSCLRITFPPIQNNIRPDKDSLLSRQEQINKCNQNIAVHKAKAMLSRVS